MAMNEGECHKREDCVFYRASKDPDPSKAENCKKA